MGEQSLPARCGLRDFDSSEFILDSMLLVRSGIELRLIKIALNGQGLKTSMLPAAKASFFGFPWAEAETISFCIKGVSLAGKVVCRICRNGNSTPWEFRDFTVNGDQAYTVENFFSTLHPGFRIEIIESRGLTEGQQVTLRLECPRTKDRDPMHVNLEHSPVPGATLGQKRALVYPRLLIIDSTLLGSACATGQIKRLFFDNWPEDRLIQIYQESGVLTLKRWSDKDHGSGALSENDLFIACRQFRPDVIYFRPVDSEKLFKFAEQVINGFALPLVVHMMDDWPERLKFDDPENFVKLDSALRRILNTATVRLSICQKMSDAYLERYGLQFVPVANGVDVELAPRKDWSLRMSVSQKRPFLIRYMGALAEDMTFDSVVDIARAVSAVNEELPIRFEIYTMPWCLGKAKSALSGLRGVQVSGLVPAQDYAQCLSDADALVIAYNFDSRSVRYIGLSMANKLPEVLASGAAVIAYGPMTAATIAYLEQARCARVVSQRSSGLLIREIKNIATNLDACRQLGELGREHARRFLSKSNAEDSFHKQIARAVENSGSRVHLLVGPYSRQEEAHYDETDCVAEFLNYTSIGCTMIDVGAHHGWSLTPFVIKDWKIYAFEPDEKNRVKLHERIAKLKKQTLVKVDSHAVSDKSSSGLVFYRSEESTGISSLSAFHPSHKPEQTVDTITLSEALAGEAISTVDFLKIDTEGHDLFVLKGFPWDRFRPAVIECEFEDAKSVPLGYTFHDLAGYLVEKGYTVYVSEWHPIIRYGIRHDWHRLVRYPCELADAKGWGNLLAFRDPIDEQELVATVRRVMKIGAEPAKKPVVVPPASAAEKAGSSEAASKVAFPSSGLAVATPYRVFPGPFRQVAPTVWHYQSPEGEVRRLWQAVFDRAVRPGQSFTGGLTIQSDCEMQVRVSLGRVGDSPYEGKHQTVLLSPAKPQQVTLKHVFSRPHSSLKVQLEVVSLKGEEAKVSITDVFVDDRSPSVSPPSAVTSAEPVALATHPPSVQTAVAVTKPTFAERLVVPMAQPVDGKNWSAPGKVEGEAVRWAAAGERATLTLSVRRHREMLVVVACHPAGADECLTGLQVEIDGVAVPHTLHRDVNPMCIVVRMPMKSEEAATELALVVPSMAGTSASGKGTPFGIAVAWISVLPMRPANTARAEAPGPQWVKQLIGLLDRHGKKVMEFPFSHFDGVAYLAANPDVAAAIVAGRMPSALFHYQRYGIKENRRLTLGLTRPPNEGSLADIFDGQAYLEAYPDVAQAVRSEAMPSALQHYIEKGCKEGRKVRTCFNGIACRGTALDLVRLDAAQEARAGLDAVKLQLSKDLAAQVGQLGNRLTKLESAVSSVARTSDLEAARAEFRKEIGLCARTIDLQAARRDLTGELDVLRKELDSRAAELAREIRDGLSHTAQASELVRVEQSASQRLDQLRGRIDDVEQIAQRIRDLLLRLQSELDRARAELESGVGTLRLDLVGDLATLRKERQVREDELVREMREGLSRSARASELVRVERLAMQAAARLQRDLEAVRGELEAKAGALRHELERGLQNRAPLSELEQLEKRAREQMARLQGDLEVVWEGLESDAVALRKDLTGALAALRHEHEAREHKLVQEMQEGLSQVASASELVRVERLGKQSIERLYDELRGIKEELEAKTGALQQDLKEGLAERVHVTELEQTEQRARERIEQWQGELNALRSEFEAKAGALQRELEDGLRERVRVNELQQMEQVSRDRIAQLQVKLETIQVELEAKAVALRHELEQGLKDRAWMVEVEQFEEGARERMARLQGELEIVRSELEAKAGTFGQELERGLKDRVRLSELEQLEERVRERMARLQGELAALAIVRDARESAVASQLEAVKASFELTQAKVELAEVKQTSLQGEMEAEARKLQTQVSAIDTRLSSADASVHKLSEALDHVEEQQATQQSQLTHPNLYAFNVLGYQAFPRQLTMAAAERLSKHWGPLLGLTVQEKELFYLAHRICHIENACVGRLAAAIDSVLLRILVARAAGSQTLEVLEIGTLFGLGIIAMHEAIAPFFKRVHFTVIDPLEGYYGKENRDILTGVPISRAVFDENLRRAGISVEDVTVIQHLSTDTIAMKEAHKKVYGLLVIDGDHSYIGVKHDFESYLGTVAPSGYVILDDYGNPSWPDVKRYIDAEVMGREDLEFLGSDWHTAVFRVAGAS